jgi:hypothetical protein
MKDGRQLDITFNEWFVRPPQQETVIQTIEKFTFRKNARKLELKQIPREERKNYYLNSRPKKEKLLDWMGNKTKALTRTMGTVDAWAGPVPKNTQFPQLRAKEVKVLGSGRLGFFPSVLSYRASRTMGLTMMVSLGGLAGWLLFGLTHTVKAESPVVLSEPGGALVLTSPLSKDEQRPGVFVWGSNR